MRGHKKKKTKKHTHTHTHIAKVVLKANQVMGSIRRTIEFKTKDNLIRLYKSLVRPHLEYCQQTWRPYNQNDIDNRKCAEKNDKGDPQPERGHL